MAIQLLKQWSFNRKLKRRSLIKKDIYSESKGKTYKIGILYTSTCLDDDKSVQALKDKLTVYNYYVRTLAYVDRGTQEHSGYVKSYSRSTIGWDETPNESYVEEFISTRFDLLICPIPRLEKHHKFIIRLTQADIKAGIKTDKTHDLYDLMIETHGNLNTSEAIDHLFKQIKILFR